MSIAKLLERFVGAEVPDQETSSTRYVRLRRGVEGGFPIGSVLALDHYCEPWPETLSWLVGAGATPCDRPAHEPDGRIDFEQVLRDEALVAESIAKSQERERRFTRAEVRERYQWSDDAVNYAMHSGILAKAIPQYELSHIGGKCIAVHEHWTARDIAGLDRLIETLFPAHFPKQSS